MPDSCNFVLGNEADVLCRYLNSMPATEQLRNRYAAAFEYKNLNLSGKEDRLWAKMMKHPRLIPFVDGGLAIIKPDSRIRHRIFLMLAISETSKEYSGNFLGPEKGIKAFLIFLLSGIRALWHAFAGIILIKGFFRIK